MFMYKDFIVFLVNSKRMDEEMGLWKIIKKEKMFLDFYICIKVIIEIWNFC